MMAGKDGLIKLADAPIGYIDNWSLTLNKGTAETSEIGEDFKKYISTVTDWTISFGGTFDYSDASQKAIVDNILSGSMEDPLDLSLVADKTLTLTGKAFVTSASINASHGDKISLTINGQGSGELAPGSAA